MQLSYCLGWQTLLYHTLIHTLQYRSEFRIQNSLHRLALKSCRFNRYGFNILQSAVLTQLHLRLDYHMDEFPHPSIDPKTRHLDESRFNSNTSSELPYPTPIFRHSYLMDKRTFFFFNKLRVRLGIRFY